MSVLVRKIERNKWTQNEIIKGAEVSADAITNCMKTVGNALSVWQITDETKLEDAVLAIVSMFDHPDSIDVALFDERVVIDAGLQIVAKPGKTPIEGLVQNHRDIAGLTYSTLGTMANLTVKCFKDDKIRRFTRFQLLKLFKDAIQRGIIRPDDLKEGIRSKLS